MFPEQTELKQAKQGGMIQARIPSGDSNLHVIEGTGILAEGFKEIVEFAVQRELTVIICYDTDAGTVKAEVQRAAAQLGYELRYRGLAITQIRQMVLPAFRSKVGLDDFIVAKGRAALVSLIERCLRKRSAFPRHPNPKAFISTRLQKSRMTRKESQDVALAILMELEARGKRLQNKSTLATYYFDEQSHVLMPVVIANPRVPLHETPFGSYLYREFNLGAADRRVIEWLAAQFYGEPGVEEADMHRVMCRTSVRHIKNPSADARAILPDGIAYQLSDSHFVIVTPNPEHPFVWCKNGDYGVLFESDAVIPLDPKTVEGLTAVELAQPPHAKWSKVLGDFNFTQSTTDQPGFSSAPIEQLRDLACLLYYLSPWFLRWRGMQLPIEMLIGEPGSGKSSIYELRQSILTGRSRLSNMTNDIKDWYAGITSSGGLHVLDNVHFSAGVKDYRQRLSDEYCRLTTETHPHIEMRKLYTSNDLLAIPVNTAFGITAVEQPFFNTDFLQRSAIFEVTAINTNHDARWGLRQLEFGGGRAGWIAHHLAVTHRFLRAAVFEEGWDPNYKARHRLANYEQGLRLMARAIGMKDTSWIPTALSQQTSTAVSESDWVAQALKEFSSLIQTKYPSKWEAMRFTAADIVVWAESHDQHSKNPVLINSWKLGRYLKSHASALRDSVGFYVAGTKNNRVTYGLKEV